VRHAAIMQTETNYKKAISSTKQTENYPFPSIINSFSPSHTFASLPTTQTDVYIKGEHCYISPFQSPIKMICFISVICPVFCQDSQTFS
jgi:hypothetical protein